MITTASYRLFAYLLPLLLLVGPAARAQAPAWQAALAVGASATGFSTVTGVAVDAAGDVVLVGTFYGTVQVGSTTLVAAGSDDMFVAKWNTTGQRFAWALRAGGTSGDFAQAVAVTAGGIYVCGGFVSDQIAFGATGLANTVPATNNAEGYVTKVTDAGTSASFAWAVRLASDGFDNTTGLAAVGTAVYASGTFGGQTLAVGNATLTSAGGSDAFVVKLTDAGSAATLTWAQRAGGTQFDNAQRLAVVGSAVYLMGSYNGPATFGGFTLANPAGQAGATFVARLNDAGTTATFAWAQAAVSASQLAGFGLAVAGTAVYVTGYFGGATATFGAVVLTNAGSGTSTDAFVARLTDLGTSARYDWAVSAGGSGSDEALAVVAQGASVYVAGDFGGSTAAFGATTLTNRGAATSTDAFVARLRDAGTSASFVWALGGGSTDNDYTPALAISGSTLYPAGQTGLPATFGSQTLTSSTATYASFFAIVADGLGTANSTAVAPLAYPLFPNPAHGRATVELPAVPGATMATLTILDALGRAVRTQTTTTNAKAELDLTGLAPGLYAVRVAAGGSTATQRLMVE